MATYRHKNVTDDMSTENKYHSIYAYVNFYIAILTRVNTHTHTHGAQQKIFPIRWMECRQFRSLSLGFATLSFVLYYFLCTFAQCWINLTACTVTHYQFASLAATAAEKNVLFIYELNFQWISSGCVLVWTISNE